MKQREEWGGFLDWCLIFAGFFLIAQFEFVQNLWHFENAPKNFVYHYQTLVAAVVAIIAAFMGGKYIRDGIVFEAAYKKKENLRSVLYYLNELQSAVKGYLVAFRDDNLTDSQIQRKLGYAVSSIEWALSEMNTCLNNQDHFEIKHNLNLPHALLEEIRQMHHDGDYFRNHLVRRFTTFDRRMDTIERIVRRMLS